MNRTQNPWPDLFSLAQTWRANDVDTYRHLIALLKALPHAQTADDHEILLPWRLIPPAAQCVAPRASQGTSSTARLLTSYIRVSYCGDSFQIKPTSNQTAIAATRQASKRVASCLRMLRVLSGNRKYQRTARPMTSAGNR
jgi:hypothetical protein